MCIFMCGILLLIFFNTIKYLILFSKILTNKIQLNFRRILSCKKRCTNIIRCVPTGILIVIKKRFYFFFVFYLFIASLLVLTVKTIFRFIKLFRVSFSLCPGNFQRVSVYRMSPPEWFVRKGRYDTQ